MDEVKITLKKLQEDENPSLTKEFFLIHFHIIIVRRKKNSSTDTQLYT